MSKRLLRLSTLRELSPRDWSVRPKCKTIKKNWRQEDWKEKLKLPDIKLIRKLGMHR